MIKDDSFEFDSEEEEEGKVSLYFFILHSILSHRNNDCTFVARTFVESSCYQYGKFQEVVFEFLHNFLTFVYIMIHEIFTILISRDLL